MFRRTHGDDDVMEITTDRVEVNVDHDVLYVFRRDNEVACFNLGGLVGIIKDEAGGTLMLMFHKIEEIHLVFSIDHVLKGGEEVKRIYATLSQYMTDTPYG